MRDPHITGPKGLPLLGNLPGYLPNKLAFLSRCAAEYGDVTRLQIGEPTLLLSNPEDIKHVLVGNAANYNKTRRLNSARGKRLSGNGLLTSFGAEHLRQRRLLQPLFVQRVIERFSDVIVNRTERAMSSWHHGQQLDIAREMEHLTQAIILGTLFGTDFRDPGDRLSLALDVRRQYIEYVYGSIFPLPELIPVRIVRQHRSADRTIREIIAREIQSRRSCNDDSSDLLSLLINAKYPDGSGMDDAAVCDEVMTLMSTGYETIGDALSWTWFLLAGHPAVEMRMLCEIQTVLQDQVPSAVTVNDLTYTSMVLDESMRLYPPTWIFVRMAMEDDVLPGGAMVPAGAKIYLCQYVVHRHPSYFPDPDQFDPGRFSPESIEQRPRFAYFPFGGGPRTCIGEVLARLEGVMILAMLARRFQFESVRGRNVVPYPGITLRPRSGIHVKLKSR